MQDAVPRRPGGDRRDTRVGSGGCRCGSGRGRGRQHADAASAPDEPKPNTLIGIPLDLVAGAALLEEEQGSADPQDLLPPPQEDDVAAAPPPSEGGAGARWRARAADPAGTAGGGARRAGSCTDNAPRGSGRLGRGLPFARAGHRPRRRFRAQRGGADRAGFCIAETKFKERRRPWDIQTITSGRPGPLWAVMHDDEDVAFDNAVYALKTYGGTLVAVETGGKRNQDGIDPNRNFSADGIGCAKLGDSGSPRFTGLFKQIRSGAADHRAAQQP